MKNTPISLTLALTIFLISCVNEKGSKDTYNNSLLEQLPHHIKLSWETSPENSQAVSWRTRSHTDQSYLEYVKATASPFFEEDVKRMEVETDTLTSDDGLWYYHSVNIENLEPDAMYSYRVGNGDLWSAWAEFKTATGRDEPFKFLYLGDVQRYIYSLGSRAIRQAILKNPDARFMLYGGDLVHRGGLNKENWNEFFPAGGWVFENIPTIATPGNHENLNAKTGEDMSPLWFLNFRFPQNGPDGHQEETFYVDYNNIRVISLNLCRYKFDKDRKEIYDWTEKVLQEFEGDWVIVTFHYSMDALARNRKPGIRFPEFEALFERFNVPLVLTGNEHVYARGRISENFPVHVVSVAGPYQNAIRFADWIERAGTSIQLYQEIYVAPDTLRYVAKTILGDVYDAFIISKDEHGALTFEEESGLPPESLIPTLNFEKRYDQELVASYESDKQAYLERKSN